MAYIFPAAAGTRLGFVYFGGLWWTSRYIIAAAAAENGASAPLPPQFVMLLSFMLRTGLVLGGFFWLMDGRWQNLCAALTGFILARMITRQQALKGGIKDDHQPG